MPLIARALTFSLPQNGKRMAPFYHVLPTCFPSNYSEYVLCRCRGATGRIRTWQAGLLLVNHLFRHQQLAGIGNHNCQNGSSVVGSIAVVCYATAMFFCNPFSCCCHVRASRFVLEDICAFLFLSVLPIVYVRSLHDKRVQSCVSRFCLVAFGSALCCVVFVRR